MEVSTSKTGKHGHAKCHFVGIDIFNGKKLEDIVPSSHNCDVWAFVGLYVAMYLIWCFITASTFSGLMGVVSGLQVPHVNRTDYQLIDISEDGFVSFAIYLSLVCL